MRRRRKKKKKNEKDFDLTILTYQNLFIRSPETDRPSHRLPPMTGKITDEIGYDLSKLKSSGVDRIILAVNVEKNYDVNETIEFVKELRKFYL
ncbi:MAG TPA: hypothetical protein VJU85_05865 [Nitrososphaeraceae archaeon]|nr:hypothetical protein [Nitrososphaeraceae archaeon]